MIGCPPNDRIERAGSMPSTQPGRWTAQASCARRQALTQPLAELRAVDPPGGTVQDEALPFVDGCVDFRAIEDEKRLQRRVARTL